MAGLLVQRLPKKFCTRWRRNNMQCNINGKEFQSDRTRLTDILQQWGATQPFVVAVNHQLVPSEKHAHTEIKDQDKIDILSPIQGG